MERPATTKKKRLTKPMSKKMKKNQQRSFQRPKNKGKGASVSKKRNRGEYKKAGAGTDTPSVHELRPSKKSASVVLTDTNRRNKITRDSKGTKRASFPGDGWACFQKWYCTMETTRSLRKEHISSCFICGRINAGSLANFVQHLDNHREDVIRSISNKEWLSAKQEDFASQIRVRGAIEEIHIALEGDLNPSPVSNLGSKAGNPNEAGD